MSELSILTEKQEKELVKASTHRSAKIKFRYDDSCGNGHNTFSICAGRWDGRERDYNTCADHDLVRKEFPEFARYIKWHLTSSDGPMHYVANTLFHVKEGNLAGARESAVWEDATDEELKAPDLKERLLARLPALMEEFKRDMESLGFTY